MRSQRGGAGVFQGPRQGRRLGGHGGLDLAVHSVLVSLVWKEGDIPCDTTYLTRIVLSVAAASTKLPIAPKCVTYAENLFFVYCVIHVVMGERDLHS